MSDTETEGPMGSWTRNNHQYALEDGLCGSAAAVVRPWHWVRLSSGCSQMHGPGPGGRPGGHAFRSMGGDRVAVGRGLSLRAKKKKKTAFLRYLKPP